jgi:O-antigen/teichoic acid export membrane protein
MSAAAEPEALLSAPQAGAVALRGSVLRGGAYALGILINLVSAPLLIRHLGQVFYGRYITITALVTIVGGLTEGGINTVALREYVSTSGAERERLMANMLGLRMVLSVLGVSAAVLFALLAGYERDMVLGALIAGLGMSMQVTQDLVDVSLQARLRFGWVTLAELTRQFIAVSLIVALVIAGARLLGFFAVTVPAGLVGLLLSARLVRGLFPLRPLFRFKMVWSLLGETVFYAIAVALNNIYFRVTVLIMSLAATALQTGYFAVSFRVVEVLIGAPALMMAAAYPILTNAQRGDPGRFARTTGRMFELAVLGGALVAMALELGAGFAVEVLGGHPALPAAAVLRIQGLAVMFTFVSVACAYPLLSLRRRHELVLANTLGLVAALALSLALVPLIAAKGAAVATVGAEATLALATGLALVRARSDLRLPLTILPVAALAAGAGIGAGRLAGVHPMVEVAVGACAYAAVVGLLGRFPPELGHALGELRRRDRDMTEGGMTEGGMTDGGMTEGGMTEGGVEV